MNMDIAQQTPSRAKAQAVLSARQGEVVRAPSLLTGNYDPREIEQLQFLVSDLRKAFRPVVKNPEIDVVSCDLTKYMYSNISEAGQMSGAEAAQRIMYGEDSRYATPQDEATFLEENESVLAESIISIVGNSKVVTVGVGNGPHPSIIKKDSRAVRGLLNAGVNVVGYTGLDTNPLFANRAGSILVDECGLTGLSTKAIVADFTKPLSLPRNADEVPLLFFFGNTISQFKSDKKRGEKSSPLEKLLFNLGKATDFSGLIYILHSHSRNCDKLTEKYRGTLMENWARSVWSLFKIGANDKGFQPCAFGYLPTCENATVALNFMTMKETAITFPKQQPIRLKKGFQIVAGWGQQHASDAIIKEGKKAGWKPVPVPFQPLNGTYGVLLAGNNLSF